MPQEDVIKTVMKQYIDRFNQDDVEGVLSLFGKKPPWKIRSVHRL